MSPSTAPWPEPESKAFTAAARRVAGERRKVGEMGIYEGKRAISQQCALPPDAGSHLCCSPPTYAPPCVLTGCYVVDMIRNAPPERQKMRVLASKQLRFGRGARRSTARQDGGRQPQDALDHLFEVLARGGSRVEHASLIMPEHVRVGWLLQHGPRRSLSEQVHHAEHARKHAMRLGLRRHSLHHLNVLCVLAGTVDESRDMRGRGVLHSTPRPPHAPRGCKSSQKDGVAAVATVGLAKGDVTREVKKEGAHVVQLWPRAPMLGWRTSKGPERKRNLLRCAGSQPGNVDVVAAHKRRGHRPAQPPPCRIIMSEYLGSPCGEPPCIHHTVCGRRNK